jgi:DNA-binding XRE family transcriptional regulator
MVHTPVYLGGRLQNPFLLAPIGRRRQPASLAIADRAKMSAEERREFKRIAWAWTGHSMSEVPDALIISSDDYLMLWDGEVWRKMDQKARPAIYAALEHYDPSADPFALGKRNSEVLRLEMKEWRRRRGWTAQRAGEELGIPLRTMQNLEQGRGFAFENLLRLAMQALDLRSKQPRDF